MPIFNDVRSYDAAFSTPAREYVSSDVDESGSTYRYYGFIDFQGKWVVRRITLATGAMRYAGGKNDYETSWTNRASLTYVLYPNLFV